MVPMEKSANKGDFAQQDADQKVLGNFSMDREGNISFDVTERLRLGSNYIRVLNEICNEIDKHGNGSVELPSEFLENAMGISTDKKEEGIYGLLLKDSDWRHSLVNGMLLTLKDAHLIKYTISSIYLPDTDNLSASYNIEITSIGRALADKINSTEKEDSRIKILARRNAA